MVVSSNDSTKNSTSQVPTTTSFALQYENTTTNLLTSQGFTEIPDTIRPTLPSTTEAYIMPNTTPPNVTTHSTSGCPNGDTNDFRDISPSRCYKSDKYEEYYQTYKGCPNGDTKDCRDMSPSQCYKSDKYDDCCGTCEGYRGDNPDCPFGDRVEKCYPDQPGRCYRDKHLFDCCNTCETALVDVPDCPFGDRVEKCYPDQPGRCYGDRHIVDCCHTCEAALVDVPGCQYGDKKGGCKEGDCDKYSSKQIDECCATCASVITTTTMTPTTALPSPTTTATTTSSSKTKAPSSTTTGISAGSPFTSEYIAPVSASVGGVLLIILVVFIILWWRRRKQSQDRLSPINEKKYNDYQLSQRAPMALPRDLDKPIKPSLTRSDSAEYAYINPDDVIIDDESNRKWNDPSLEQQSGPVEYLELGDADKYGYLEALGLVIEKRETPTSIDMNTCKQTSQEKEDGCVKYPNEHKSPQRSNTYGKFPTG